MMWGVITAYVFLPLTSDILLIFRGLQAPRSSGVFAGRMAVENRRRLQASKSMGDNPLDPHQPCVWISPRLAGLLAGIERKEKNRGVGRGNSSYINIRGYIGSNGRKSPPSQTRNKKGQWGSGWEAPGSKTRL
eukprot:1136267-Pelagomonas_calceolata.AAC.1